VKSQMTTLCMRVAYWIWNASRAHTHINIYYIFQGNNGVANAPQLYVLRILPVLLVGYYNTFRHYTVEEECRGIGHMPVFSGSVAVSDLKLSLKLEGKKSNLIQ
jgi:hypothetical protein